MTTLAKAFSAAEARDDHGRWSGSLTVPSVRRNLEGAATRLMAAAPPAAEPHTAPVPVRRTRAQGPAPQGARSLTRGEGWQRIGAKLPDLPPSYTGSSTREAPVDGWKELSVTQQIPKGMPVADHIKLLGKLKQVIAQNREGAIEKAKITRMQVAVHGMKDRYTLKRRTGALILDPETPKGAVHRAYNHAAMLALHDAGVIDYGPFKMSDAQKTELTPLVPFMRYTRNRLFNAMHGGDLKGAAAPYKAAFGKPFADNRKDRVTGAVRMRLRPNQQLVKIAQSRTHEADISGTVYFSGCDWPFLKLPLAKATPADLRAAAARVAVNPTPAQTEAGNYTKGHVRIGGLAIAIENRRGSIRRGTDSKGTAWQVKMPAHYGYVKKSTGADGDHVDVYLGPHAHNAPSLPVHVIDQVHLSNGKFDEHKAMVGFRSKEAAIKAYDAGYADQRGPDRRKAVTSMPFDQFKTWVVGYGPATPLAKRAASACLDPRVAGMLDHAQKTLRRAGKRRGKGVTDPHVAVAMGDVERIVGTQPALVGHKAAARNEAIRDPRIPLAHVLSAAG